MGKIKRPKVDQRYVVVDTSVLFHEDKSLVVNPTFEEIWNETSKSIQISLVIPEVVKGELCYQQTKLALKSHEEILKNTDLISKISDHQYSCKIKSDKIVQQVNERFDKWCKTFSSEIIKTPIDEIVWDEVIDKSIWRKPPFSKEGDKEKGFKDTLILKTLLSYVNKYPSRHIVFICKDRLLRDTAEQELSNNNFVTCFAKIDEFKTNINLLKEKLTLSFVDTILRKARIKFFKTRGKPCLFYSANIREQIEEQFKNELEHPNEKPSSFSTLITGVRTKNWKRVTNNYMYIDHPEFIKLEQNDVFHWKTEVSVVAYFINQDSSVTKLDKILSQGSE